MATTSNNELHKKSPVAESRKIDNIFVASREQSFGSRFTRRFVILSIFLASKFRDIGGTQDLLEYCEANKPCRNLPVLSGKAKYIL